MAVREPLSLLARLAGAAAAVARDALAGPRALPLAPAALADPERLGDLLAAGPLGEPIRAGHLEAVRETPIRAPSSNCRNSVLALDWAAAAGDAPASVFVKQPSPDLPTRLFANVVGFWRIECAVCRSLAAAIPIETPRIYGVAERGSRFVLVMENLAERPATRVFDNRMLLEGVDPGAARRALETLASLHAAFAGLDAAARERALPTALHPFLSPSLGPALLALNRLAVSPCRRRAPELFDRGLADLYRRALSAWPRLLAHWYREPLTLVHGDSHLGNFFESGEALGMLDFQGAHWSRGMRDVAYFLVNSMPSERLARHERELVRCYAEAVTRRGSPLDPDDALEEYRAFSFQILMTAVVSLGLGSFTESDAVIRTLLERATSAVRRLGFGDWLDSRMSPG
jgi:aminoglycoside phosphotransferase (APT) family kinase protein